jgi:uncharacterized Ntn-hydrolase superfamily protein
MFLRYSIIFCLIAFCKSYSQKPANSEKFAHTFSIIAQDPKTGDMAVTVQSHWFSEGTEVPWGKSGVGVVATQSFVNERCGHEGLQLMLKGLNATQVMEKLKKKDSGVEYRQVAMLSKDVTITAFTGENCVESASHLIGNHYSIQANMMEDKNVVYAMRTAFEENENLDLSGRIVVAMEAAQSNDGDIRRKQSSALTVVGKEAAEHPWLDKKIDLRVDDHKTPAKELSRLLNIHRTYKFMASGYVAMENKVTEATLKAYNSAEELLPNNEEIKFWKAVALVNSNQVKMSILIFERLFMIDKRWQRLLKRLPSSDLITIEQSALNYLLNI